LWLAFGAQHPVGEVGQVARIGLAGGDGLGQQRQAAALEGEVGVRVLGQQPRRRRGRLTDLAPQRPPPPVQHAGQPGRVLRVDRHHLVRVDRVAGPGLLIPVHPRHQLGGQRLVVHVSSMTGLARRCLVTRGGPEAGSGPTLTGPGGCGRCRPGAPAG
jgi:hypothetical protein